ncbi:hypothetical protein [Vibrio genomosp. F10]|uniref:hypothetical protein n=1 Tax=Vibrio genomosp. F10 TaxID=723171 RepID=UPI0002EDC25E|nr:hypothetical protein [Vibrio genomosp. F10]
MSFQMLDSVGLMSNSNVSASQSIQPTSSSQLPDCHSVMNSDYDQMNHHYSSTDWLLTQSDSLHCDGGAESAHNCCTATCVNVMAFIPNLNNDTHLKTRLSRIETLNQGERVHRPHSLYRPPIA